MSLLETVLHVAHTALLAPLVLLGLHRGYLVALWLRYRRRGAVAPPPTGGEAPRVIVQLPIYNERFVAARLVEAAAALEYPADRMLIQVLDDSTDDTPEIVARAIPRLPDGTRIQHFRRSDRTGFKAGALARGLEACPDGEFVAVFDADFVPPSDFLVRTLPHFDEPRVGMVQARWGHRNADESFLTATQAALLDGHFLVEHVARSRAGYLFNFNGTAGVFRRACIEDAGGWQHDTLTEDIDLSYRAQLAGWRFVYLPDLVCPADLPTTMNAFLNQQHRWAKGAVQVGLKLQSRIRRAPISLRRKVEAGVHLFGNVAFPLLLALILVALPLQLTRLWNGSEVGREWATLEALPLLGAVVSVLTYYGVATRAAGRGRLATWLRLPWLFGVGAALSVNNSAAFFDAFNREPGEFVRTPKHGGGPVPMPYRSRRGLRPLLELGLGAWAGSAALASLATGLPASAAFHGLFAAGLTWAGWCSLVEDRQVARVDPQQLRTALETS